jgi:heme oxygenase
MKWSVELEDQYSPSSWRKWVSWKAPSTEYTKYLKECAVPKEELLGAHDLRRLSWDTLVGAERV